MNSLKQHEIGIAGFALLKNWLIGDKKVNKKIINELANLFSSSTNSASQENFTNYNVRLGYKFWADTYDSDANLLIDIEQPFVESILENLPDGKFLDAACGTGRYIKFLNRNNKEVIGIDQSIEMLKIARKKYPNIKFIQGDIASLPFRKNDFDNIICALALTHFKDIKPVLTQFYNTLKPEGYLLISDINPWFILLGGQADFHDKKGDHGYIKNYIHWHSKYLKAFNEVGFRVISCEEPVIKDNHLKLAKKGFYLSDKVINAAFKDIPIALIWKLQKI